MKGAILGWGCIVVVIFIGLAAAIWLSTTNDVNKRVTDKAAGIMAVANTAELVQKMLGPCMSTAAQRATWELGQTGGIASNPAWSVQGPDMDGLAAALGSRAGESLPKGKYVLNGFDLEYGEADVSVSGRDDGSFTLTGFQGFQVIDDTISTWNRVNHDFNVTVNSSYFRLLRTGRMLFENGSWPVDGGVSVNGMDFTVGGVAGCSGKLAAPQTDPNGLRITDMLAFSFRCGRGRLPGIGSMGTWDLAEAQRRAERIATDIGTDMGQESGLLFDIRPDVSATDTGRNMFVTVRATVNMTDISGWVPLMPGESSAVIDGVSYPLARQQLIFRTENSFDVPKPSEVIQG